MVVLFSLVLQTGKELDCYLKIQLHLNNRVTLSYVLLKIVCVKYHRNGNALEQINFYKTMICIGVKAAVTD